MNNCKDYKYDVVLSFAGEDRKYVEKVANYLSNSGVKVFYDRYEDVDLWGKDLYQHLDEVYQNKAKFAVVFISDNYGKKLWTNHELKSAQARAFSESEEYILPARFDDTEIPGIRKTIGYVDLSVLKPVEFGKKILKKLGDIEPENFLPDKIPFMIQALQEIYEDYDEDMIETETAAVFGLLKKTSERERNFLSNLLVHTCRHDLEEDLHEDIKYLERLTGYKRDEILEICNGLTNLGFEYKLSKSSHGTKREGNKQVYENLHIKLTSLRTTTDFENITIILYLMYFGARRGLCEKCSIKTHNRLDFTMLQEAVSNEEFEFIKSILSEEEIDD